jgi:predicted  nucleic acid-binding Zn-ribbon protein
MLPDLEGLVKLQHAETELRHQEALLAEIPVARQRLDARLQVERARVDAARGAQDSAQKTRKQLEASVQDLETRRSKYKGQLMDVKTNKEYTAMLHEIESVETEIRAKEDGVLAEMEKLEALTAEIRKAEGIFKEVEAEVLAERKDLETRDKQIQIEASRAQKEREEAKKAVPPSMMGLFERVARLRGGVGVSEAKDGSCTACHVKLRLQLWSDIRKNNAIIQCPACQRVLFYEPPVPTVDVEA